MCAPDRCPSNHNWDRWSRIFRLLRAGGTGDRERINHALVRRCYPAADTDRVGILPIGMQRKGGPMHRLLGLLALMAAGLGLYLLFGPEAEPRASGMGMESAPIAYSGWALGLVMGLALAWLAGVDWSNLPERIVTWVRMQRRRLWLAVLGSVFASILLLF
jgi:hypothetical protein